MSPEPDQVTAPESQANIKPSASSAFLLHAGRRIPVTPEGVTIGRGEDVDIALAGERASRVHARVHADSDGTFWVTDLGSRHGTFVNGKLLRDEGRPLASGDTISIDAEAIRFVTGVETRIVSREVPISERQAVRFDGERLTIGRDAANDIVLVDPNVSRFHAELIVEEGNVYVVDLGSRNGTRLDGEVVERAALKTGAEVGIGSFALVFDGTSVVAQDQHGALRLDTNGVAVRVREKQILAPTSISIAPGEFVAIIGESGSGKSTLMKTLAGVSAPSSGTVTVNGEPLAARLTEIGYVPQDDIVHRHLTVREALTYAARLRLPHDSSDTEIAGTVERVVHELALTEHIETMIGSLSGGQRKRVGVAAELLSRPSLLFLDEPTTGLDPGLETKMMELLRELANRSRAVAVVTHATKNLRLCDRVAVMGRGGELTFFGTPAEALEFFEADDFDGIYGALDATEALEWRRRFESRPRVEVAGDGVGEVGSAIGPSPARIGRRANGRRALLQTRVLVHRYCRLILRDRRNLALLVGQAPLLGLFNVALFKAGLFDRPGGRPVDAAQLLFLLVIAVIWLGSIDAAREIVKERSVFEREHAIGTTIGAYLASKAVVLFGLVAVQTLIYAGVVLVFQPFDAPASAYLEVLSILVLTGFASIAMGLLISAAVSTEDQAMSLNPLALIPQLLFAGAIIPVDQMTAPVKAVSNLMFAQWSLAGIGTSIDMNGRIAESAFARVNRFGADFFDVRVATSLLVLFAFLVVFVVSTAAVLRRRARSG